MKRRSFVKLAAGGAAAWSAGSTLWGATNPRPGANERLRVAIIGIRGHGFAHTREFSLLPGVEVAALCDVDESLFAARLKWLEDAGKPRPAVFTDLRKLFEDASIDAVSIVTPNHWHTPAAIWALQAGKHVTVEKPCCHTFREGQWLVEAARRSGRVVQHGTESRTNPVYARGMEFLRQGGLGEVYLAKGLCYKWRDTIGRAKPEPVPDGVHYDLWMGPAPARPFTRNRFHYNWHWQWDYGNGDMGNQGVHEMDIARWGLGVELPTRITATGGHFMFDDDQETPNQLLTTFEFPADKAGGDRKKILQFEVRHWISNHEGGMGEGASNTIGNVFYGSEGYLVMQGGGWRTFMGRKQEPGPAETGRNSQLEHSRNFVEAIRANDPSRLTVPIVDGHRSCALIHLGNIAYRTGRALAFDPQSEKILGDAEASRLLTKTYRKPYALEGAG
jgi:predicted dehydrogenase